MQVPTEGVYRAAGFVHDERASGAALIEVVARWGDEVLSVTHLRPGERFALEDSRPLVAHTADGALLTPPAGASGVVRVGASSTPLDGPTLLRRPMSAELRVGALHVSVRAVADEPAAPRRARFVAFRASLALLLTLSVVAGVGARDATEHPAEISVDDGSARAWLTAHLPPSRTVQLDGRKPETLTVYHHTFCGCGNSTEHGVVTPFSVVSQNGAAFELLTDGMHIAELIGPLSRRSVEALVQRDREWLWTRLHATPSERLTGVWLDLNIELRHGVPMIASMRRVHTDPFAGYEPLFASPASATGRETFARIVLSERTYFSGLPSVTPRGRQRI